MLALFDDAGTKTVLLTGADGFTGRYMTETLRSHGYCVVGISLGNTVSEEIISCDITNSTSVFSIVEQVRPDYVIHLAALSFVGESDPEKFYQVNLFGTLNLLESLGRLDISPKKVLIASSANVYGTPGFDVLDESVCPNPVNHYANSKLAMEHMVRTWYDRLPIIITRPFNYTGPGQSERFLIPKIVGHFRRREREIKLGNLDVSRDFSDVRDVVKCYLALLESDTRSAVVNICSGEATPLREIIEMMNSLAGYEIIVRVDPALIRTNEIPSLRGSNLLLKKLIGFSPNVSLLDTLRTMNLHINLNT